MTKESKLNVKKENNIQGVIQSKTKKHSNTNNKINKSINKETNKKKKKKINGTKIIVWLMIICLVGTSLLSGLVVFF